MTVRLFRLVLTVLFIASIAACATTTKPGKTEKPVDQASQQATQFEEAKAAFDQQNYERSALLLKPLAEQGHTEAQYALGYMYHKGLGVPHNYRLAIQWLSLAASKGNEKAMKALRRLSLLDSAAIDSNEQAASAPTPAPVEITKAIMDVGEQPQVAETPAEEVSPTEPTKPVEPAESVEPTEPTESVEPTEPVAHAITTETLTTLTDDEQWIMNQPDDHYTIQLLATRNEAALQRFINKNNLHDSAVYYQTQRNSENWFTLIQGSFKSFALARSAIKKLAPSLQIAKPWVKPIAGIQEALVPR